MTTIETTMKIENWDEQPITELSDGSKVARAAITLTEGKDGLISAESHAVFYYRADGTAVYTGLLVLEAELEGRRGRFTLLDEGTYDGKRAASTLRIVEGSGTGELAGITGTGESASTQEDYPHQPFTLDYSLT